MCQGGNGVLDRQLVLAFDAPTRRAPDKMLLKLLFFAEAELAGGRSSAEHYVFLVRIHLLQGRDIPYLPSATTDDLGPIQSVLICVLSKLFQTSVIVMADVNVGLAQFFSDLA